MKAERAFGYVYSEIRYPKGGETVNESILDPAGGELKQVAKVCHFWRSNEQLA